MKKLFTILVLAASALPAMAQHMLIEKQDNAYSEVIDLANLKQITFNGPTVSIEQTDGTVTGSTMSDIEHIRFGDFTSINETSQRQESFVTYISNDAIAIFCPAGTTVTIYDIIGSQVLSTRLKTEGGTISIAGLPQGIYIVKANDKSAKILKR